ncbi:unnamed protein product [Rotaria sp. Silwood2]|nr:unnamed protein product [Rotaria sp. Silwood2]CAF2941035.1 unnamed protein product [Rotaria sp. Silwood2]CAF3310463.1 unnamed protein product [Rotaria sp. Silwood2]CAF4290721.1 unnamed protein product [Rotaria sp. Silwood2]CAF4547443.1 unnamed protein product [Rotaria sp. Silwood2]
MLINAFTAAQAGNINPSQVQPHMQHTTTNPYHHTMDPSNSILSHSGPQVSHGIKTTSDDTIPGMKSAPLAPLGDTIPPMPSVSHEQGVAAGSGNSYRHLFSNYPPLQSTSDDRNKVQMKCIKGEYERTYRQPTTSYSPKSSSSSSTTTSKMVSSSTDGGGVGSQFIFIWNELVHNKTYI